MAFSPFQVTPPHLAYAFLGGFVVLFGLFSSFIRERLRLGEAPVATVVGIIIGPHCLNLFNPYSWGGEGDQITNEITLEVTRVVIALSVFAAYVWRHWRTLFFLLGPCMIWGWMVTALLIWGLLPGHNFLSSLVIAACLTPTDPILAQAVIGGKFAEKHVPAHVRHMLAAESGCNDGAAFPFLYIAIYLLLDASPGHAVGEWIYHSIAYEVLLGIVIGALLGWSARKIMKIAEKKRWIDRQSYVAQYVSLAILSIGISTLLGSDDLLSAFACGAAFAWDGFFNKATEDAVFSNVIDLLFNCAAFIYIGALIPFEDFNDASIGLDAWRLVVMTLLVLLLRRMPVVLATYKFIPDIKTFREALFAGWFGPMGVGAIFISTLARLALPEGEAEKDTEQVDRLKRTIIPIVSFLVLSSIVTHGLSIPFFSLGRRVHSITYTLSRNPSMDTRRGNEPAWTTHARRVLPGQSIRINRDDDPEEGDMGVQRRDMTDDTPTREKLSNTSSTEGSGDSGTNGESMEMREREKADGEAAHGATAEEREQDEEERVGGGRRTPPLSEYREGMDLVIERRRGSGEEVEVEVVRNYYNEHAEIESEKFNHPHSLRENAHLVGQFLRHPLQKASSRPQTPTSSAPPASDRATSPSQPTRRSESPEDRQPSPPAEPKVVHIDPARLGRNTKPSMRQRFFGRFNRENSSFSSRAAEEGRSGADDEAYLTPNDRGFVPPAIHEPAPEGILSPPSRQQTNADLSLERTATARSIRFSPETAEASGTAPTMGNYGMLAPGFKRNPTLSMDRTRSYHEEDEDEDDGDDGDDNGGNGQSVSFRVPDKRR